MPPSIFLLPTLALSCVALPGLAEARAVLVATHTDLLITSALTAIVSGAICFLLGMMAAAPRPRLPANEPYVDHPDVIRLRDVADRARR